MGTFNGGNGSITCSQKIAFMVELIFDNVVVVVAVDFKNMF